ncbi:regulator of G-protein signaling 7 [Lucilia sericata]|uniref:regulator of G-protein signaling 7 n=1 Tax=Lucilia sericata TaxID=13632 RepID=UPI0018A8338F|nr:regulator of G-protein signaling 7 [Lucilia sericata]XP_037812560.1 regulator of G-protein signaling 7 [Lucilia sericata]XP_037812561.1 regulator of G-protein signaling 7 [Lucilia sericata]
MVTMSTEVDTTQTTIATNMSNKMPSITNLNSSNATTITTTNGSITEINDDTTIPMNNGCSDIAKDALVEDNNFSKKETVTPPILPTAAATETPPSPQKPSKEEPPKSPKPTADISNNKLNPQITITESEAQDNSSGPSTPTTAAAAPPPPTAENQDKKDDTNTTTVTTITTGNSSPTKTTVISTKTETKIQASPEKTTKPTNTTAASVQNTTTINNSSALGSTPNTNITTATTNNNSKPSSNSNSINQNLLSSSMNKSTNQSSQQQSTAPGSSSQTTGMGCSSASSSAAAAGSHQKNNHHTHNVQSTVVQSSNHNKKNEDAPNILVYKKMEAVIEKMQAESTGVSVRTVKGFMTKVPSVFTGADLISWILKNLDVEDVTEALHFAHLLASHGYIFPIDDHQLTVKNDGTFYRFQTPYFWPSNCWEPENTDYAVYLCKRTMQNKTRLELADYEAENLAKLQKMFSRKWEFIFMQAESQSKVAKKRDKLERKVLDSQERAFWDVHRPMPGCVNTTEIDIKKAYRRGCSSHGTGSAGAAVTKNPIEQLTRIITLRKQKLERRTIKVSKAAEALVSYYEQYNEFDYFITSPELPNPWQTDSTEMWEAEKNSKEVPMRRVKRWAFSMRELLKDPMGREQFAKFLEKEYSYENLLFWEAVQDMKALPQSEIKETIQRVWNEFLAPDAPRAVNVDSKSVELAREAVNSPNGPNRWCFDVAAAHVYHLMERDSYPRYLRSDMYKDYINCSRKKVKSIPNLFGVKR